MIASERRRYIMENLKNKGIISLKETAKELGIAEITVRRDFEKLELEGMLKRVQGGAALEGASSSLEGAELTMAKKVLLNLKEKEKIAEYAASLVQDGDCIFVDGGTTMLPLVEMLSRKRVILVTYNMLVLKKLVNAAAEVFIIGGKFLPYYNMNIGPVAQDMLRQFCFDFAFLGCSGADLTQRTVYMSEMESLLMKRIALENAKRSFLLLDASKFEKKGIFKLSDFSVFEKVVCNTFETKETLPENFLML